MKPLRVCIGLAVLLCVGGCASYPTGPSALALPGTGKTFDRFRQDDNECQRYAFERIGGLTAEKAAEESAVRSAAIGTAVGVVAGAAIGGSNGAGVGAGTGLLLGSAIGTDASQRSAYGSQKRYDDAYIQCMYARGHRVPVPAEMARQIQQRPPAPPAYGSPPPPAVDAGKIPEPPHGNPPPPPPGH
ncbi:MAG: complement resistance protein TraT [Candidatus Accumulibacter sp.]|jgi:hypothetical protein|nr:complement resistance protein TraT [Accumulibacter sp.]